MGASRSGHVVCRKDAKDGIYPPRAESLVVDWDLACPQYAPVEFVTDRVLSQACDVKPGGYADPAVPPPAADIKRRGSHELLATRRQWVFDDGARDAAQKGRPLNPRGRTGITNRGRLGKWGANHAGDAIVTRRNPNIEGRPLEFVAIKRKDTGEWAIPGGMVDPGEIATSTLRREFREEATALTQDAHDPSAAAAAMRRFDTLLETLFNAENGRIVYRGYVDDPRNTDNAWMETLCMHFHVPDSLATALPLRSGDDACDVKWLEMGDHNPAYLQLYASHKDMCDQVLALQQMGTPTASSSLGGERASERRSRPAGDGAVLARLERLASTGGFLESLGHVGGIYGGDAAFHLLASRQRLNSKPSPQLLALGAASHWKSRAASMSSSRRAGYPWRIMPPPTQLSDVRLTNEAMLDVFSVALKTVPILRTTLAILESAEALGAAATEATVKELAAALVPSDALFEANIYENLHALLPWHVHIPPIRAFMQAVFEHVDAWTHDSSGRVDNPPMLPPSELVELTYAQLMDLKRLAFVSESPQILLPSLLNAQHRELFESSTSAENPTAIVSVGTPGSGKSYVIRKHFMPGLVASGVGPPEDGYLTIDPDVWITNVLHNDNSVRVVANYLNHETFMTAIHMRRNMFFDGTGRDVRNTCGRVISRLRQAGYKVHIVMVLSSYDTCMHNITERRKVTGRDVPAKFVKPLFEGALAEACETYVRYQPQISEQIAIFDNDKLESSLSATVRGDKGTEEALALIRRYLR